MNKQRYTYMYRQTYEQRNKLWNNNVIFYGDLYHAHFTQSSYR